MERLNKKELERVNKREKPAADKPDSHTYLFVVLAVVASFLPITVLANTAAVGGAGSAALLVLGGMVAGIAGMGVLGRTGQAQRISADTQASSDREEPAVPLIAANQNAANDDGSAKRREAALQEKMALLKQRNKAICEAARGVAHDFNNLLMTIQGSLELIHSDPGYLQRDPSLLEAARTAVERSRDLSTLLVDMASHREREVISMAPGDRLSHLKPLLRAILGNRVQLDFMLEGDLWPVRAHPGQFDNALINLAVNARHAMPAGGLLEISAENTTVRTYRSDVYGELEPGKYVHITVRDSGAGIDPSIRDHIFESNFTTRPAGEGSGLGLAMVSQFVAMAHGHITVESAPGEGAEFHLYLPQDTEADTSQPGPMRLSLASSDGRPSLQVIGDA